MSRNIIKSVTVEPVAFLYCVVEAISSTAKQNLLLEKVCHPLAQPGVSEKCLDEITAEKTVTDIQTGSDLIILVGPVLFILFAGPWSDNNGRRRKPLIYLPLCGQIFSDLLCFLNTYFWTWSPGVAALSGSVPVGITGWRTGLAIGVISYISDITLDRSKTMRIGILIAMYYIATPIGFVMFVQLDRNLSFLGVFLTCVFLNTVTLVYCYLFIPENKCEEEVKSNIWNAISLKPVAQSFGSVLKSRSGYDRAILVMSVLMAPVALTPKQGEVSLMYFFLRFKFGWSEVEYGYFGAYTSAMIFFGSVASLGLLSHLLQVPDAKIGMLGQTALIAAAVWGAFASTPWEVIVYPLIKCIGGAGYAVIKSIISKVVEPSETVQALGVTGVAEALFPMIIIPLYNQFYKLTFTDWPGAFFMLTTFFESLCFVMFSVIYILQMKENQQKSSKPFDEASMLRENHIT